MIEPGIKPTKEDWPKGLLKHLQGFRQGDVVKGFPAVYIGNPNSAVHEQTAVYQGSESDVIEFGDDFPYGIILTQTCDIIEEDRQYPKRPWIWIAPVYNSETRFWDPNSNKEKALLDGGIRKMLVAGGGPQYLLHLPGFIPSSGIWVADFRLMVSVEKGWLLERDPIPAFSSENERRGVGKKLASLFTRPAFDTRFEESVRKPFINALKDIDDMSLYDSIQTEVDHLAVKSDDNVKMDRCQVWVLSREPLSSAVREWFDKQDDQWHRNALDNDLILLESRFSELRSMTAEEYLNLTMMPLSDITPEPPWYGTE